MDSQRSELHALRTSVGKFELAREGKAVGSGGDAGVAAAARVRSELRKLDAGREERGAAAVECC
eukprot:445890-Pleurochrysis_carterae.AAC.1